MLFDSSGGFWVGSGGFERLLDILTINSVKPRHIFIVPIFKCI